MNDIRDVLTAQVQRQPDLQGLVDVCGESPQRSPPKESSIAKARKAVAKSLGLSAKAAERTHPASPWKWKLVEAVQRKTGDPDVVLSEWLRDGAPFGVAKPIPPGGLLPRIHESTSLCAEELFDKTAFDTNHGSFREIVDGTQPAMNELKDLVEAGFARICLDEADAKHFLGQKPVVSPLGNVTKKSQTVLRRTGSFNISVHHL